MNRWLLFWMMIVLVAPWATGRPLLSEVSTWEEAPKASPVIDRGPEGAWDHYAVDNPFLLEVDGTLYCFYEGQDKPLNESGHERIGLAVSRDGLHWKKHAANPILGVGEAGAFDSVVAKLPVVISVDGTYYLFYSGRDDKTKQIGLATSTNLTTWTKHPGNPVLPSRAQRWDRFISTYPAPPMKHDGRYYLLYRGMASLYKKQGAGLAVSDDLVHWKRAVDEPVITVAKEIASFAVSPDGEGYAGIAQAPTRCYWRSDDLRHWMPGMTPRFTGHRVDTLSNPVWFRGDWMIVYEQEDRIYRAVGR